MEKAFKEMYMRFNEKDRINRILTDWFWENISNRSSIAIGYIVKRNWIYIYSNRPGILCGKGGACVNILEDMLKEVGINKRVNLYEIGYGSPREMRLPPTFTKKIINKIKGVFKRGNKM